MAKFNRNKNKKYYGNRGSQKKPSGKGGYTKRIDIEAEDLKEQVQSKNFNNDPSWYFTDSTLMDQVCSFSFDNFVGKRPIIEDNNWSDVDIPAIMEIYFNPSVGWTDPHNANAAGINIAARKLYTKLSSMNAKTTGYMPADLAILMCALSSIISATEFIRRAFGVAFLYNKRNWAYPKRIIEAMGIDFDDFIKNMADYRIQFNSIMNSVNVVDFPADCNIFKKAAAMYSHIYVDSESPMAQTYLFNPATLWYVAETGTQGTEARTMAWCCTVDEYSTLTRTMGDYLYNLQFMINELLGSSVFNLIYADVLRLFSESDLLHMPYLDEGYSVSPEYDPMILIQIRNMALAGIPDASLEDEYVTVHNDVTQDVDHNSIKYMPHLSYSNAVLNGLNIIDYPHSKGNPDTTQRVEATRFIVTNTDPSGAEGHNGGWVIPDHYPVLIKLSEERRVKSTVVVIASSDARYVGSLLTNFEKFSHAPMLYLTTGDNYTDKVSSIVGDIDYFTTISARVLDNTNKLALVTLFTPGFIR